MRKRLLLCGVLLIAYSDVQVAIRSNLYFSAIIGTRVTAGKSSKRVLLISLLPSAAVVVVTIIKLISVKTVS